ncbi:MAG: hypothetical protein KGI69_03360 [Patescibacteria group bacterium]|nr:hypothetical protein [Patescibacteria group bacterium]
MPLSADDNRIEDLKRSMYSRTAPDVRTRRKLRFTAPTDDVKRDWEHPPEEGDAPAEPERLYEDHSMSFFTKLLIGSAIFCLAAVGIGAYLFFNGANLISANNINIAISGPVSIPGGSPVTLAITVTNKNSVELELADLEVDFPAGATDPADTTKSLQTYQKLLGTIAPGASVTEKVSAIIFGQENLQKVIAAKVTYGIKGSSSVFTKEQTYDVLINSSPVTLSVSSFNQITSGQPFDITVDVKSNSQDTLKNVLLKATYPFGYSFSSASLPPLSDNATWAIGDMPPGSDRTVVIHGALAGSDSDLRAFHFTVGARSSSDPLVVATPYMDAEQDITIEKPFVSFATTINNNSVSGPYSATFGKPLLVSMHWTNNLPEALTNAAITVHLSGSAYDPSQVSAGSAYFRSSTNDIIWNQQNDSDLASVPAGASGDIAFSITPADTGSALHQIVDPEVDMAASVSADRTSESGVPQQTAPVTSVVKISSNVTLSGRIERSQGPFANAGPVPPVADQKTTYTVVWTVDNTSSAVGSAVVTATLPPYVSWLDAVSPSTENVTYDKNSGTVTWDLGTIDTYTLSSSQRRQASFQVAFLPSVDQVGTEPTLVNQAVLTAVDNWTGATLQSSQGFLTTSFSTDPAFVQGDQIVTKGK